MGFKKNEESVVRVESVVCESGVESWFDEGKEMGMEDAEWRLLIPFLAAIAGVWICFNLAVSP